MQIQDSTSDSGGWHADRLEDVAGAWTTATVMWAFLENGLPTSEMTSRQEFALGTEFLKRTQVMRDNQRLGWPNIQEKIDDITYSTAYVLLVLLNYEPEKNVQYILDGLRSLLNQQNKASGGFGIMTADENESWTRATSLSLEVFLSAIDAISSNNVLKEELSELRAQLMQAAKRCAEWLLKNKKELKTENKTLAYWYSSDGKVQSESLPATAFAAEALSKLRHSDESMNLMRELNVTENQMDSLLDSVIRFIVSKQREDDSFPDFEERKVFPTFGFQSHGLGTPLAILAICQVKPSDNALFQILADAVAHLVGKLKVQEDGSLYYSLTDSEESTWASAYAYAALGRFQKTVKQYEESWLVNIQESVGKLQKDFGNLKEGIIKASNDELKSKLRGSFKEGGIVTLFSSLILVLLAYFNTDIGKGIVNLLGTVIIFSFISTAYFCRCFKKPDPVLTEEKLMPLPRKTPRTVENLALYRRGIDQLRNFISMAEPHSQYFSCLLLWKKRKRFLIVSIMMVLGFVMTSLLLLYLFEPLILSTLSSLSLYLILMASVSMIFHMAVIYVRPTLLIPNHS